MIRLRLYLQLALLCGAVALASWLYFWWVGQQTLQWFMPGPSGYNGEYAQALLKGQLHLREAPEGMLKLEDPYDPAQYSPFYTFDLSYYQGRIYSYFGVVPPLLLFLPWRLLTGVYPTDQFGTGLFMTLGLVLSLILLAGIRRRFLPNSPAWTVALAVVVLAVGNQSLLLFWPPYYCQTVQSAARCLQLAALIASVLALTSRRPSLVWFSLASVATGLMVCTRPSFVLASSLLVPIWLVLNRRALETRGPDSALRSAIRPLAAGLLPITLIALAQMAFNFARFDSPVEFGTTYQQFGIDLRTITQFSPAYMPAHILVHLFSMPEFLRYFPFLVYDEPSLGALILLPFSWFLLLLPFGWRTLAGPDRGILRALAFALVLAAVGNLVMLSGYYLALLRHQVDIVLPLTLAAAVGLIATGHAWQPHPWRRRALAVGATFLVAANVTVTVGTAASYPNQAELPRVAAFFNQPVYLWEKIMGQTFTNTLRLTLTFPTAPADSTEELLSLGADKIDAVFVRYLDSNRASLGFFHTELGAIESRPFAVPPGVVRNVDITLGSLSPPTGHPAFSGWSRSSIDQLHRRLRLTIDGKLLLDQDMLFHTASPGNRSIGGIAKKPAFAKFSGAISHVSPLPLQTVPPRPTAWPQGPVHFDAVFANRRVGRSDPLVVSGTRINGDLLWVTYLDETRVQFVFDHGLTGQTKSTPMVVPDTTTPHRIEIRPDAAASLTVIAFDGAPIITLPFLPFPAPAESVFFGIQTFPAACEPIFGGRLEVVPATASQPR